MNLNNFNIKSNTDYDRDFYNTLMHSGNGTHKNTQYHITFDMPQILSKCGFNTGELSRTIDCYCNNVSIPFGQFGSKQINVGGEGIDIPVKKEYQECILEFNLDNNMLGSQIFKFFNVWMDKIYNPTKRQFGYYNNFISSTVCIKLNSYNPTDFNGKSLLKTPDSSLVSRKSWENQNPAGGEYTGGIDNGNNISRRERTIAGITLHDVWITNIQQIQLNGSSSANPTTMSVNLKYRYSTNDTDLYLSKEYNPNAILSTSSNKSSKNNNSRPERTKSSDKNTDKTKETNNKDKKDKNSSNKNDASNNPSPNVKTSETEK